MLLQHQHTKSLAVMNNRHTQKGVIALLPRLGKIAIAWVVWCVVQVHRLSPFGNKAHQPPGTRAKRFELTE